MSFDVIYTAGIQKAINEKAGQRLACDGQFGPKSVAALKLYQAQCSIPTTGIYDTATQSLLDTFIKGKYLTMDSFNKAAANLNVTPAHIRTVCDVEAQGAGFLPDGRVKILFERHHFIKSLRQRGFSEARIADLMKQGNADIISTEAGGYVGNEGEYKRFERACAIDLYSAYYATSFGLFQIMGFNFKFAGYNDLTSFVADMKISESKQLMAFVEFNKNYKNGVLWSALKAEDWPTYALNYNGSAYKKNNYDTKLSGSFTKYSANILAA